MFLNFSRIKVALLFILLFQLSSCVSSKIKKEQKAVIESLDYQIFQKIKNDRVKKHGIVLKETDEYNGFIELFSKELFVNGELLEKVKDTISIKILNKKNRDYYIKQLKRDNFKLATINFNNKKLIVASNDFKKSQGYLKANISMPVFSIDKRNAIIFYWRTHEASMYIFRKKNNKWEFYKSYNTLFSNINH